MTQDFGILSSGEAAHLYTIADGGPVASISDLGATLVSLLAPGRDGQLADVVLGFDSARDYLINGGCLGAVVGRNANRVGGAAFPLHGETVRLTPNEGPNNLHSGPDFWYHRLWKVERRTERDIRLSLDTPHGDQGFPGSGHVAVTYRMAGNRLEITYEGCFDRDTVFNMTNHAYFNMAGQDRPQEAMEQALWLRASRYTQVDGGSIPTGQSPQVAGTALDFRTPRVIGRGLERDPLLAPQGGIDHNFLLDEGDLNAPAARLTHPASGRTLTVYTSCPGVQVYCANGLEAVGKGGVRYGRNSGVCLETQFYPDSMNHPHWPQPLAPANTPVCSTTVFAFTAEE